MDVQTTNGVRTADAAGKLYKDGKQTEALEMLQQDLVTLGGPTGDPSLLKKTWQAIANMVWGRPEAQVALVPGKGRPAPSDNPRGK